MEQQCESFTELESKFFSFVPYDNNDPDFTWHKNREDESSSYQSESPRSDPENHDEIKEQVNATSPKEIEDLSASYSKLPASLVTPGKEKAKVCRWDQQPWNGEKSNSDADEKFKEIIIRRRRLILANASPTVAEKGNANIPVKYPCDIYPSNWGSVKTVNANSLPNSPKSNSQPLRRRSEAAFSRRSFSPSSIPVHVYNSSRLSLDSCESPCKRFKGNASMVEPADMMPCYKGYQLLGDSQLVRFSEQLLGFKRFVTYTEDTHSRRIGYCVSGQKIKDLEERILKRELPLSDKLIMLIGTNDMVYNTNLEVMYEGYVSILNALKENAKKIVILTVPPVPKLAHDDRHVQKLKVFNQFVTSCADDQKVFVVDLASLFMSYSNTVSTQYFEESYGGRRRSNPKVDLIHLNRAGFMLLNTVLDITYFDKYSL